ncbi:hypothetical protein D3C83_324200 [compost metagenome]
MRGTNVSTASDAHPSTVVDCATCGDTRAAAIGTSRSRPLAPRMRSAASALSIAARAAVA